MESEFCCETFPTGFSHTDEVEHASESIFLYLVFYVNSLKKNWGRNGLKAVVEFKIHLAIHKGPFKNVTRMLNMTIKTDLKSAS